MKSVFHPMREKSSFVKIFRAGDSSTKFLIPRENAAQNLILPMSSLEIVHVTTEQSAHEKHENGGSQKCVLYNGGMRKSKRRRPRRPANHGTYRGFHWERVMDGPFAGAYYSIRDHAGKSLGGSSDYKGFIQRWQAQHGVPEEIQRKQRERGMARVLSEFMRAHA